MYIFSFDCHKDDKSAKLKKKRTDKSGMCYVLLYNVHLLATVLYCLNAYS